MRSQRWREVTDEVRDGGKSKVRSQRWREVKGGRSKARSQKWKVKYEVTEMDGGQS